MKKELCIKLVIYKYFALCMAVGLLRTDNQNQNCYLKFRVQDAITCDAWCNYWRANF